MVQKGKGARCAREAPTYSIFIKVLALKGLNLILFMYSILKVKPKRYVDRLFATII